MKPNARTRLRTQACVNGHWNDAGILRANDTEFGLASYVYTQNLGRARRVGEALKYGMVGINEGLTSTEVAPFGGI